MIRVFEGCIFCRGVTHATNASKLKYYSYSCLKNFWMASIGATSHSRTKRIRREQHFNIMVAGEFQTNQYFIIIIRARGCWKINTCTINEYLTWDSSNSESSFAPTSSDLWSSSNERKHGRTIQSAIHRLSWNTSTYHTNKHYINWKFKVWRDYWIYWTSIRQNSHIRNKTFARKDWWFSYSFSYLCFRSRSDCFAQRIIRNGSFVLE